MVRAVQVLSLLSIASFLVACGAPYRDQAVTMSTVADLSAERYSGLWYEIARYPVPFQRGCTATTAQYGVIDATAISVVNTCREGSPEGPIEQVSGVAEAVGPGQFKVRFDSVPFLRGDYWVLWVDPSYETAVVGVPSGRAGWILARTPTISDERRAEANAILEQNGYSLSELIDDVQ